MPYLQPSQAQKHVTHNLALQVLDAVTQLSLQSLGDTAPPGLPVAGDVHVVGTGATGAWSGQDGMIAAWDGSGWQFVTPRDGWRAWALDSQQLWVRRDGAWRVLLDQVDRLGIGTAADQVNRLAVASEASLFSHAGTDHRMVLNKAAAGDTVSVLFQSGWTGHAEFGLAGDTAFALKTSADGNIWDSVLRADPTTQEITLAPAGTPRMVLGDAGLLLDVPVSGAAVQASAADATSGRLLTVGAFGAGNTGHLTNIGDWDASDKPSGLYLFANTTANLASKPVDYVDGNYGLVRIERYSANYFTQTCWKSSGDAMPFRRRHINGSWTSWERLFGEYAVNGTGKYLRLEDGTQIVWGYIAPDFTSGGNQSFPFPAEFASGDAAGGITGIRSGSPTAIANFKTVEASGGSSQTNIFLKLSGAGTNGTGVEYQLTYMFVGRWF
jgi:hypothetical protein